MKMRIEKVENGFLVAAPTFDAKGEELPYNELEFVFLTLDEVIEKVKEVYGVH